MIFCEAGPDDVPVLLTLIRELAAFERAPDAVKMSEAQLHEGLFGPEALAEALLVKIDGVPQAMAIWGRSFNTWTGRPGMAIEDVYVREACRGRGVGKAIFAHLAGLAVQRGYLRVALRQQSARLLNDSVTARQRAAQLLDGRVTLPQ